MKNIETNTLLHRARLFGILLLLGLGLLIGSPSPGSAQGSSEEWAISQAQQAVRERIAGQEGGRDSRILFNNDAVAESRSRGEILVRGTGIFTRNNNARNDNARNNDRRGREFTYEAIVNNRNRNRSGNVSGIRYDWRGGWSDNDSANDRGGGRVQNIYCASDDGRRHTCPINTSGGAVRLVNQKSGSACVQGRTWGFNNAGIWVDRGCRADFEVSGGRGYGNNNRGNIGRGNINDYENAPRPNGRVSYSGPIMNRHSDKALDVTNEGLQDGANIQQWSFADQPNQNWDIIDLGNNEVAIISRHSGRALTVQGGRNDNGSNIIQRSWNNTRQQRWRLEQTGGDYYRIVSVDNGKCLDVTDQSKENGANVQLWSYANQANQQWRFKR